MQGCQKGAYTAEDSKQWTHNGMIKYPFLKKAVSTARVRDRSVRAVLTSLAPWCVTSAVRARVGGEQVLPPSDWNPLLAKRSAQAPSLSLELKYVFGYGGPVGATGNVAPGGWCSTAAEPTACLTVSLL